MKKIAFLFFMLAIAIHGSAQTLIAHYDFTNAAVSGTASEPVNHLNGVVHTSCAAASGKCGAPNTALKFNGTSSVVTVPADAILDLTRWTMQAIVYIDAFETSLSCQVSKILQHGHQYGQDYYALEINDNNDDPTCGNLNYCNTPVDTNHMRFYGAAAGSILVGAPSYSLHTGQWYCLTATYSHDTMKYYVNGVLNYTRYWPNAYAYTGAGGSVPPVPLYIGKGQGSGGTVYYFNGVIDDVKIYDDALNAAEVAALCDSCSDGCSLDIEFCSKLSAPLVYTFTPTVSPSAYCVKWNFGDGTGTSVSAPGTSITHTFPASGSYNICAYPFDCYTGQACPEQCFTLCLKKSGTRTSDSSSNSSSSTGSTAVKSSNYENGIGTPYPNPANSVLNIPVQNLNGLLKLTVIGQDGKLITSKTMTATGSTRQLQISTPDLKPGTYILEITSGNSKTYKRFSKL